MRAARTYSGRVGEELRSYRAAVDSPETEEEHEMSRQLGLAGILTDQPDASGQSRRPQPMTKDMVSILADVPLFSGLSRRHMNRVGGLATTKWFQRGATLVRAGA